MSMSDEFVDAMKALELTPRSAWPTPEELVGAVERNVELARPVCDVEAIRDAVDGLVANRLDELKDIRGSLKPGFEDEIRQKAERDIRGVTVKTVERLDRATAECERYLHKEIDNQRQILTRTSWSTPDPNLAAMLRVAEAMEAQRFDAFVTSRPVSETLKRYNEAPDTDPFVRYLEGPYRAEPQGAGAADGAAAMTLSAAIRARRDTRVRPEYFEAADRLKVFRADIARFRLAVTPSTENAAEALRVLGTKSNRPSLAEREDAIRAKALEQQKAERKAAAGRLMGVAS